MSEDARNEKSEQSAHLERVEIKKTTEAVKDSAKEIRRSAGKIEGSADRSTELAADRTVLAAERTYAAWIRTGLAALASGVGARALLADTLPDLMIQFTATILILFSAFCFCAAVWRQLVPKVEDPVSRVPQLPRLLLFLVNGSLAFLALCALASIWIARFNFSG
jgi:putative membrane protein